MSEAGTNDTQGMAIAALLNDQGELDLTGATVEKMQAAYNEVTALSVVAVAEAAGAMQSVYHSLEILAELQAKISG